MSDIQLENQPTIQPHGDFQWCVRHIEKGRHGLAGGILVKNNAKNIQVSNLFLSAFY